ncbi:hypothetical protein SAMN05660649_00689 [Desulfotomaculum arcticum]|uniref:Uncharacterized protein n=1 Tax=Desulfotruncus arcticus DSM 17038 TaxID=1121424 RepID=A0A1I2P942_9FIRM|nr:hypothetical protein SAMN05660649_00689 [Desulfotomaculum arcticum] [Desulfotruncus arcticus DSM 17038]
MPIALHSKIGGFFSYFDDNEYHYHQMFTKMVYNAFLRCYLKAPPIIGGGKLKLQQNNLRSLLLKEVIYINYRRGY